MTCQTCPQPTAGLYTSATVLTAEADVVLRPWLDMEMQWQRTNRTALEETR